MSGYKLRKWNSDKNSNNKIGPLDLGIRVQCSVLFLSIMGSINNCVYVNICRSISLLVFLIRQCTIIWILCYTKGLLSSCPWGPSTEILISSSSFLASFRTVLLTSVSQLIIWLFSCALLCWLFLTSLVSLVSGFPLCSGQCCCYWHWYLYYSNE